MNYPLKISLNLIFISSIIFFNSALVRSDPVHIRYSSGLIVLLFVLLIFFYIFYKISLTKFTNIKKNIIIKNLKNKKIYLNSILIFISFVFIFLNKNLLFYNLIKIKNYKVNLVNFLSTSDEEFLKNEHLQKIYKTFEYSEVLRFYKEISKEDNCVQVLTADVSFPYFLNKPTCTKFYNSVGIITTKLEKKFIDELNTSSPNVILFESPVKHLLTIKNQKNFDELSKFITNNYEFYHDFKGFIFLRKKIYK